MTLRPLDPKIVDALYEAAENGSENWRDGPTRALVKSLVFEYRNAIELAEHRVKLLNEAWRQRDRMYPNESPLTKVEAHQFLQDGTLPENFAERLRWFIKNYECRNCDGQENMNVLRHWFEDSPSWCPECVLPVTSEEGVTDDSDGDQPEPLRPISDTIHRP